MRQIRKFFKRNQKRSRLFQVFRLSRLRQRKGLFSSLPGKLKYQLNNSRREGENDNIS